MAVSKVGTSVCGRPAAWFKCACHEIAQKWACSTSLHTVITMTRCLIYDPRTAGSVGSILVHALILLANLLLVFLYLPYMLYSSIAGIIRWVLTSPLEKSYRLQIAKIFNYLQSRWFLTRNYFYQHFELPIWIWLLSTIIHSTPIILFAPGNKLCIHLHIVPVILVSETAHLAHPFGYCLCRQCSPNWGLDCFFCLRHYSKSYKIAQFPKSPKNFNYIFVNHLLYFRFCDQSCSDKASLYLMYTE